jgi:hypothetical protein
MKMQLHRIAHARAGDKGNRSNIALIAYEPPLYETLRGQVTIERVRSIFAAWRPSAVQRFELPRLFALNFVLDDLLEGGVNASLGLDGHGKSLSFRLLDATVEIEPALARFAKGRNA